MCDGHNDLSAFIFCSLPFCPLELLVLSGLKLCVLRAWQAGTAHRLGTEVFGYIAALLLGINWQIIYGVVSEKSSFSNARILKTQTVSHPHLPSEI